MNVKFNISKGRQIGKLLSENSKTVWVQFKYKKNIAKKGAEDIFKKFTSVIKRHKLRHNVVIIDEDN